MTRQGWPTVCGSSPIRPRSASGHLKKRLVSRRAALVEGWLDRAVRVYPPETAALFRRERDPFGNPVGHALSAGIRGLVDGLLSDADAGELGSRLEPILQIRSVQSLAPSQALGFVFMLKDVIREELGDEIRMSRLVREWFELEGQIDELALVAFDLFTRWRERAHDVRVRDLKRHVAGHLRRLDLVEADGTAFAGDAWGGRLVSRQR